jgi:hypothetical protein
MANDCDNPNCGWKLYEVKIDTTTIQINEGKTKEDKAPKESDKPTAGEGKAHLEHIRDDYNDSTKLTIPFKKNQCSPCECTPVGDPLWEKNAQKGWKLWYNEKGWIVSCDAEIKFGKQLGVCNSKNHELGPLHSGD